MPLHGNEHTPLQPSAPDGLTRKLYRFLTKRAVEHNR
jgi:hypothetical protein